MKLGSEVIVGVLVVPAWPAVVYLASETSYSAVGHGSRPKTGANPIKNSLKFTSLEYTKLQVQLQVFICPHTTQPELATS